VSAVGNDGRGGPRERARGGVDDHHVPRFGVPIAAFDPSVSLTWIVRAPRCRAVGAAEPPVVAQLVPLFCVP
jgi:hypothetical protein